MRKEQSILHILKILLVKKGSVHPIAAQVVAIWNLHDQQRQLRHSTTPMLTYGKVIIRCDVNSFQRTNIQDVDVSYETNQSQH